MNKEMKRQINIVSLVLAAAMVFAACQKDEMGLVSLNAEISNYAGAGSAKMYVDGSRYTHWTNGDQVKINGGLCSVNLSGSKAQITDVPASDYGYTAVYPASIATSYFGAMTPSFNVTLPTVQTYSVDGSGNQIISAPMIARCNKGETTLTFRNLCSLIKVTVNNDRAEDVELQSITVTSSSGNLSGVATISNVTTTPSFAMGTDATNHVALTFSSETVAQGTSKDYYIVVPAFSASDITIAVSATSTGILELSKTTSGATLSANTIVQGPTLSLGGVAFVGTEENP